MRRTVPSQSQRKPAVRAADCVLTIPQQRLSKIIDEKAERGVFCEVRWRYAEPAKGLSDDSSDDDILPSPVDRKWRTWYGCVHSTKWLDAEAPIGRFIEMRWLGGEDMEEILCNVPTRIVEFPPKEPIEVSAFLVTEPRSAEGAAPQHFPPLRDRLERAHEFHDQATAAAKHLSPQDRELRSYLNQLGEQLRTLSNDNRRMLVDQSMDLRYLHRTLESVSSLQGQMVQMITQMLVTCPVGSASSNASSAAASPVGQAWLKEHAPRPEADLLPNVPRTPAAAGGRSTATTASGPDTVPQAAAPDDDDDDGIEGINSKVLANMLKCKGSCGMSCIDQCTVRGHKAARAELEAELKRPRGERPNLATITWLMNHGQLGHLPAACAKCGSSKDFHVRVSKESVSWVCRRNVQGKRCQKQVSVRGDPNSPTARNWSVFGAACVVLFGLGGGQRLSNYALLLPGFASHKQLVDRLARAATIINLERMLNKEGSSDLWKNMQWDETFHAQRKFQRGHRVRLGGVLTFVGGVTMAQNENGEFRIAEGIVAGVPNKGRAQQLALLLSVVEPNAKIATDSAAMYRDLKTTGVEHSMVNHAKEFVAADGTHTNAIEGFWSVLKRKLRLWWASQTSDDVTCAERYQLAAFFANASFAGMSQPGAAMLLQKLSLDVEADDNYGERLENARGVMCVPTADALQKHLDDAAEAEAAFVHDLERLAAEDDDESIDATGTEDNTVPLNQLSATGGQHDETLQVDDGGVAAPYLTPAKAHRSEGNPVAAGPPMVNRALSF